MYSDLALLSDNFFRPLMGTIRITAVLLTLLGLVLMQHGTYSRKLDANRLIVFFEVETRNDLKFIFIDIILILETRIRY